MVPSDSISRSKQSTSFSDPLPEHRNRAAACITYSFFKKYEDRTKFTKKKIVSVIFSHAVFPLLSIHDNLVMQTLVWLHMVRFRAIWFGASYANLREKHCLAFE